MLRLWLVVLGTVLPLVHGRSPPEFNVIVIIPHDYHCGSGVASNTTETIEEELLFAAVAAEERLRQLQLPFTLNLKRLRTDCGYEPLQRGTSYSTNLVRLAHELVTSDEDCDDGLTVAVTGYFCKTTLQQMEVIGLGNPDHLGLCIISVNTFLPVYGGAGRSMTHYYHLFPSALAYAEALYHVMKQLKWTRHGIIFTENQNSFHFDASQQLIRWLKDRGLGPTMKLFAFTNGGRINSVIRKIHRSGVRVLYLVLPPLEAVRFICKAYTYGLRWPDYTWMVPELKLDHSTAGYYRVCPHLDPLEGVITFLTVFNNNTNNSSYNNDQKHVWLQGTEARGLYDSILSIAYSLNLTFSNLQVLIPEGCWGAQLSKLKVQTKISQSLGKTLRNVTIPGVLGIFSLPNNDGLCSGGKNIAVYQRRHGDYHNFGYFQPDRNTTTFNFENVVVTTDLLSRENKAFPFVARVILDAFLSICLLLSVGNVFLYVCYRNQPEIKATSVGLSMLIHLSCFLPTIAAAIEINKYLIFYQACLVRIWIVYPTLDLIIATLLVKVIRIYHIFNNFATIKKVYSDKTLLLAIALIVIVKLGILSCWTIVDPYSVVEEETLVSSTIPPHYVVTQHCYSRYYFVWTILVLGYTTILGSVLAIVAFKVRKIERQDFKDTKKINIALSVSFTIIGIVIPMWWILRMEKNATAIQLLLPSLYLSVSCCYQLCILCPKTFPPLRRSLKHILFPHSRPRPQRSLTHELLKRPTSQVSSMSLLSTKVHPSILHQ